MSGSKTQGVAVRIPKIIDIGNALAQYLANTASYSAALGD